MQVRSQFAGLIDRVEDYIFNIAKKEINMGRTLIYYKPEYIDVAMKLRENYIAHQKEADIISEEEQDDINALKW